ncbi:MAG: hypothetical protein A3B29_05605 [Candidatus Sungbacteria bacterium RIFCSPLOWO2_01_FULL_51_34]|nr:MAG: hypothetical protein A3B29_05605 [Candidatus Sungbacteria bacterium RIFCSPLOWO2_01_FULL_51_34]
MPGHTSMQYQPKRITVILLALGIVVVAFGTGYAAGTHQRSAVGAEVVAIQNQEAGMPNGVDFALFWDVWSRLERDFVDKKNIDRQKLVYGAIDGLVQSLGDPYTTFFPPEEAKRFNDDIKGEFGGIGAEIGIRKGVLTVIAPLKDSPAERAGLLAGDKVLKINGTSTTELSLDQAVSSIRGVKGTPVTLTIARERVDGAKDISVVRDSIRIPVYETKKLGDGIFYVHLFNFNENAADEFRRALQEMHRVGASKLILDLRNNPGGYLNHAVDIASWFLPAGEVVAREVFASGKEVVYRSHGYVYLERTPVVVIINQGSASASEILAGALRDKRNITIVGEKSYGKGSVQELEPLPDSASLKITIAKWLTPNGFSINDSGIEPDIAKELQAEDVEQDRDPQLDAALEAVRKL